MTKLKETIHFENEEGICKICVELGRQEAQKEIEKRFDDWAEKHWVYFLELSQEEIIKWRLEELKSKLKSAATKMNSNTSSNADE